MELFEHSVSYNRLGESETVCFVASFNQLDLSYESEKGTVGKLSTRQRRKVNAGINEVRGTDAAIDLILQGESLERANCLCIFQKHVHPCDFLKSIAMMDYSNKSPNHFMGPLKEEK